MSTFLAFAGDKITGVVSSLANKILGDKVKDFLLQRKMKRLVEDAVDRIVSQTDEYLRSENADDHGKEILITCLCDKLQPLADEPQKFFAGDLDGRKIFDKCHPKGELPEAIRHEGLEQFYTVLFPQIAHFLAGSRFALVEWQAEGYREGFRRLSQIADEISGMSAKVTALPGAVVATMETTAKQKADTLLRELAQTVLTNLLLRLDLSPLRAERSLHGSLSEHFVIPQFRERKEKAQPLGEKAQVLKALCAPGARRIVHGGAGAGKTTCALWLQSQMLQATDHRLAVLIRLRQETNIETRSLLDIVKHQAGVHLADSLTYELLRGWHEAGKLVLILDGFDEVPESQRDAVEKWIKDLGIVAKQSSLIVTSRSLQSGHLEELPKVWQQWDLLPFDEARIIDFIQRWHRHLPDGELSQAERQVDVKALARTFLKDPSLNALADTPLMLGTLLFVHHRDKKLPSGRVDLYERYIAAMLGLRDSGLGIQARATKLTDKEKRRVLAHIALHFLWNSVNEVNDDTMRMLVTEVLVKFRTEETADCLLPALCERTGLIQGPGAWSFMHKTIGEFLVAELVCEGSTFLPNGTRLDRQELLVHRHEDPWTVVLFFWAGKTTPREFEEFIEELVEEEGDAGLLLAIALLGDQGERLGHDIQHRLAMRVLERKASFQNPNETASSTTGVVPSCYYTKVGTDLFELRGLAQTHTVAVFMKFFIDVVLTPDVIKEAGPCCQDFLTVSLLWSLSDRTTKLNEEVNVALDHIERHQRALFIFCAAVSVPLWRRDNYSKIDEWLLLYPECSAWLPLLLIGAWGERLRPSARKHPDWSEADNFIGPLLWNHHAHAVDDEWLVHSLSWKGGFDQNYGDILQKFRNAMLPGPAADWGLNNEQHQELVRWLNALLLHREHLRNSGPA